MTCDISKKQNSPEALLMLRGLRHAYSSAKELTKLQLYLEIALALAGPAASHWYPQAKTFVIIVSVMVVLFNFLIFQPRAKKNHELGAKIQERFDEAVLSFPWTSRHRAEPGIYQELAEAYVLGRGTDDGLKDWYAPEVSRLPIRLARLVCQRTNMRWDARLRMNVWLYYLCGLLGMVSVVAVFAAARHMTVDEIFAQVVVPVVPIAIRIATKLATQKEAATKSEEGKSRVDEVWKRAMRGELTDAQLDEESQALQEGLYERRLTSPQVPDWLYERSRKRCEIEMRHAVHEMVEQALKAQSKKKT